MPSDADRRGLFPAVAVVVVIADLVTKLAVEEAFAGGRVLSVWGEFLQFRLVYNPGAAFGLHLGPYSRWIFLAVAVVALGVLARIARTSPPHDILRHLALGLVAGGAAGNLVDRIRSTQGVVDFIDVGVGLTRWPTFNVADIGVTCGALALAYSFWREDKARARSEAPSTG